MFLSSATNPDEDGEAAESLRCSVGAYNSVILHRGNLTFQKW